MPALLQDAIVIVVALAAAAWMVRSLVGRLLAPSCAPPPGIPPGHDGFVPLDGIAPPPGRRRERSRTENRADDRLYRA